MINYILFAILFLFITNWFQIISFFSVFSKKVKTSQLNDKWISKTVKEKTGLNLKPTALFHTKKMFGMMAGLPFRPKMILSEGLYKDLNKDELEWVVLHEAGHCVLLHNLKAFLIEIFFLIANIFLIYNFQTGLVSSIFVSIFMALVCIQVIRWVIEFQADKYSIERVENPKGIITAQNKFDNAKHKNLFSSERSLLRFLLRWNISRTKRIQMAKERMSG